MRNIRDRYSEVRKLSEDIRIMLKTASEKIEQHVLTGEIPEQKWRETVTPIRDELLQTIKSWSNQKGVGDLTINWKNKEISNLRSNVDSYKVSGIRQGKLDLSYIELIQKNPRYEERRGLTIEGMRMNQKKVEKNIRQEETLRKLIAMNQQSAKPPEKIEQIEVLHKFVNHVTHFGARTKEWWRTMRQAKVRYKACMDY